MMTLALSSFDWPHWLGVGLLGLLAGVLGGMVGVGGSVIMIPGLVVLFGQGERHPEMNQHLYQASAMIANVAVAVPATLQHLRAGAVDFFVLRPMLAMSVLTVFLGVALSNLPIFAGSAGSIWLGRALALLLVYVIVSNVMRELGKQQQQELPQRVTVPRSLAVGGMMGTLAGLLGVGGGAIAVPMQQFLMRMPLRRAIATSAAAMCVSAGLGACFKLATLGQHHATWTDGILLGAALSPTCWLGGRIGGQLTHRLPVRQVRWAFVAIMAASVWKLARLDLLL